MSEPIRRPGEAGSRDELGGKAGALAALHEAGLPIPLWFVVTPQVAGICRQATDPVPVGAPAGTAQSPAAEPAAPSGPAAVRAVADLVADALAELCPNGELVAVRSSAVDEDGAALSFAGQLESWLFVSAAAVPGRVLDVWASAYSDRALAYRREHQVGPPRLPAVLVQRMVTPVAAGVAFSADPISGRRSVAVVSAVYGLGTALVSGEADADTWHVGRDGSRVNAVIAHKTVAHRHDAAAPDGLHTEAVAAELADQPALTDAQVQAVAELARRCERFFGRPQDIEWALEHGPEGDTLWLLQSRPITSLADLADPEAALCLWDNSNIIESYGGHTTPLTFSFARHVYEQVYRQMAHVLGVPNRVIEEHDDTFRHMLGYIQGRVYYNLLSWYRLLALLPGFTVNRRFMEQMMGVREGLPEELVPTSAPASRRARVADGLRLAATIAGLLRALVGLDRRVERFYALLDSALEPMPDLATYRADELVAYYRRLERQLIRHWDAPLLNDLFAMSFFGLLRSLTVKWCGPDAATLSNDLLSGDGGMVSAEPATLVRRMAQMSAGNREAVAALCDETKVEAEAAVRRLPELAAGYDAYLARFADRCLEELKLESPTLSDDPLPLLRSIGQMAASGRSGETWAVPPAQVIRLAAQKRVAVALHGHPVRSATFGWVLGAARKHIRMRENLRFERTRVFGRVRRIMVELGGRFAALNALDDGRDVFFLELDEILGFVQGTDTTTGLRGLVDLRRAELDRWKTAPAPPDRFATRGVPYRGQRQEAAVSDGVVAVGVEGADARSGLGCCPGVVRGTVRVVRNPQGANVEPGEILVAERTDPGWVMLFPAAAGVLVERGSLLSHSAIVARELGIPTIVAVPGLLAWLADGDVVEMDGATGVARRVSRAGGAA